MSFVVGQRIEIEGRTTPYDVVEVFALEGGGWHLDLRPPGTQSALVVVEIYRNGDGVWRTEELEEVKGHDDPAPEETDRCLSCGAPIRWSWTEAGKKTPINLDGGSHWLTCPQRKQWRGRKRSDPETDDVEIVAPYPPEPKPTDDGQLSLFEQC